MRSPEGGRRAPWCLLPFLLPFAVVSPSSSRPCQRSEMKVPMRQCPRFEFARLSRDCGCQRWRDDSVHDTVLGAATFNLFYSFLAGLLMFLGLYGFALW